MKEEPSLQGPLRTYAVDVRRRLRVVLGLLLLLLIAILASSFFVARGINTGANEKFVNGSIPLKAAVQDLQFEMVNQETGSRGYVISADRAALRPLLSGRAAVPGDLNEIAKHVSLVPALAGELARIRVEVAAIERHHDRQVALVSSGPAGQRAAAKRIPQGAVLFDRFRLTAGKMLADTDRFIVSAREAQNRLYRTLTILLLVFGGAALVIAVAVSYITPRRGFSVLLELERERQEANVVRRRVEDAQREVGALVGRLQASLLPVLRVDDPHLQVAAIYHPGEQRLQLGGDFYDCLELQDGRVAFLIGDVSGHGPDAAALGASLRSAWRGLMLGGVEHGEVMRCLQAVFEREGADEFDFATAAFGQLDPARAWLQLALAGHPPPILLEGGTARLIDVVQGPPLGVFADADWPVSTRLLPTPSAVVFYTDGVTEALVGPGSRQRVGLDWLVAEIASACAVPVREHDLEALVRRVGALSGEPFADDVAILAVSVNREDV